MATEKMSDLRRFGRALLEGCGGFSLGWGATFAGNFLLLVVLARIVFPDVDGPGLMVTALVGQGLLPIAGGALFFMIRFFRTWRYSPATQPSTAPDSSSEDAPGPR
jgi:hypothetical protein